MSRAADYELVIRTTVLTNEDAHRHPPQIQIFRRAAYLRQLATEGWSESALENLNERLDNREDINLHNGVWLQVHELSVHQRAEPELGSGRELFKRQP